MDHLLEKTVTLGIGICAFIAVFKVIKDFAKEKDDSYKKQMKKFLIICFFLGAVPGLTKLIPHMGQVFMAPIETVSQYIASTVSQGISHSLPTEED